MVAGIKSFLLIVCVTIIGGWSDASYGVDAINPFSSYGQIQNVQTYSSNPFWNPNGGYRQNMPVPVYVTGPDVSSGDCERTIGALIASICANNNNCHNMQLSDIRPTLMLQLSRLPGHNWATSCAGFIDTAFDSYMSGTEHTVVPTSFPTATTPNPTADGVEYKIPNPLAPKIPDWMREMKGREIELKQLQSQNGAGQESLARAEFPLTYEDLSLAERWANEASGYKPYEGKSPYAPIKIKEPEVHNPTSTTTPQGVAQKKSDDDKVKKEDEKSSPEPKKENAPAVPEPDKEKEWAVLAASPSMVGQATGNLNYLSQAVPFVYSPEMPVISLNLDNGSGNSNAHPANSALDRCLDKIWQYVSNLDGFTEKTCCTFEKVEDFTTCQTNNKQVNPSDYVYDILKTDSDCLASKKELSKKKWFNAIPYSVGRYASVFVLDVISFKDINDFSINLSVLPCYDTVLNIQHIGENN